MMRVSFQPVAFVRNDRNEISDDFWGSVISIIELAPGIPAVAFENIEQFSHLEIIYYFDQVNTKDKVFSGHPGGNTPMPRMGIFAQRKKDRPNAIGLCNVKLIEHSNHILKVKYLEAINGTRVPDIKPVIKAFQANNEIREPARVNELMKDYWK